MRTWVKWVGIVLMVLVVGFIGLVFIMDWNWVKGAVASVASDTIGQTVTIEGDLNVDLWSWTPRVRAERIRVDNVDWGQAPHMLTLRRLAFQIDLRQLLHGRLVFPEIELLEPVAVLERSAQGELNWTALGVPKRDRETETSSRVTLPSIKRVDLRDGRITYHDADGQTDVVTTLATLTALSPRAGQTLEVQGRGQVADEPFELNLTTVPLDQLEASSSVPLQVHLEVGNMPMQLDGTITQPLQLKAVDMEVLVSGPPPAALWTVFGLPLRSLESFRLAGHLSHQGEEWQFKDLSATLGESDVTGSIMLQTASERPFLRADLTSNRLVVQEITSLVNPSASQQAKPADGSSKPEALLPSASVPPEQLRAVDGELHFQGETVVVANRTLHQVSVTGQLQNGHLLFKPAFDTAGGTVQVELEVDGRQTPLHSSIQADIQHVDLRQVLSAPDLDPVQLGVLDGEVTLRGTGHSLTQLVSTSAGKARLSMRNEASDTQVQMTATLTADANQDRARRVELDGEGRVQGKPFQLTGQAGWLTAWRTGDTPYPVHLELELGDTMARVDGTLQQVAPLTNLDVQFTVQGADPAAVAPLLPMTVPHLPAYELTGHLVHDGTTWTLDPFHGSLGASELSGTLSLRTAGERPFLRGDVQAPRINITELTGATSADTQASPKTTSSSLMPQGSLPPKYLQMVDADLRLRADKVITGALSLEDVSASMQLQDGHLKLSPEFNLVGGRVQATLEVKGRETPIHTTVHAEVDKLDLRQVMATLGVQADAFGTLSGHTDLTAQGHTLDTFLDTVDGDVVLLMSQGRLDQLLVELLGLDVAETILSVFTGTDATVRIRCAVADFAVQQGRMEVQTLIVSTSDTKIVGNGFIDVGNQQLDLTLQPQAKDLSVLSADAPLLINGTFSNLSVSPDIGKALLSLATPVELGTAEAANCQALLQEARSP